MGILFSVNGAFSVAPTNPRESVSGNTGGRATATSVAHRATVSGENNTAGGTRVLAPGRAGMLATRTTHPDRSGVTRSATRTMAGISTGRKTAARTGKATVARSAIPGKSSMVSMARAGKNIAFAGAAKARSAKAARATAIFSDVSKIGGGYASCRESYATCMDQLCANANDTYRRCFCSDRFTNFRNTEQALDQAMGMLRQFEDNNLNAVDKTAAEVSAMYSATVGEQAIKKDTSAAQQVLDSIGDLLSGKTKPAQNEPAGLMSFSADLDDVWGSSSSLFDSPKEKDMSEMEGGALFASAQQQCIRLSQGQCENDAVFNMAKSSYNILITQDCNLYEKTLDKKKQNVTDAVRQAEKVLRDSRLEEYRAHNSNDVNECIDKVRSAMTADAACGANYVRCLDPTGAYISATTGEPIFTPKFFELDKLINLNGSMDVVALNKTYNDYLDGLRARAASALDTCRDQAEYVWSEFKRMALIEIAQAQSEKIEEVKSSCVSTIAECYDTQTDGLNQVDNTKEKNSAAIGRYAARDMCKEKVVACAALYGGGDCKFDDRGKLANKDGQCGLKSLLAFVSNVDNSKAAELCGATLEKNLKETCTPPSGEAEGYPWNCKTKSKKSLNDDLTAIANVDCQDPTAEEGAKLSQKVKDKIDELVSDVADELDYMLSKRCDTLEGWWLSRPEGCNSSADTVNGCSDFYDAKLINLDAFYNQVYGRIVNDISTTYGKCVKNVEMAMCLGFNTGEKKVAQWNKTTEDCEIISDDWYKDKCKFVTGVYKDGVCYKP